MTRFPEEGDRDNPVPFYIFTGNDGTLADLAPLKRAKAALDLDVRIAPRMITQYDRHRNAAERVLAIDVKPTWLTDYALVTQNTSDEGWQRAVKWVITGEFDPKATTITDILVSIFGPGTREISEAELASEEAYRVYLGQS